MTVNLKHKIGTGLSPEQFVQGMTKNQEKFMEWQNRFAWLRDDDEEFFKALSERKNLRALILAADWCGDVIRNVPVVFHALKTANIPTEVLIMEQNLDVMDQFLTMGGRSIPIVIFTDVDGNVLGQWGPRPKFIQEPMVQFKQTHTDKNAPNYEEHLKLARAEVLNRYGEGTDYQQLIVEELRELLEHM